MMNKNKSDYSQLISQKSINYFIQKHQLPEDFEKLILNYYIPLISWISERVNNYSPYIFGINGPIGSGKSTLADFIRSSIQPHLNGGVAVLSLDDFYFTKKERVHLSKTIHPLLIMRGVPGTHDISMLLDYINRLKNLTLGREIMLPQFNKAKDDREPSSEWRQVTGPIDLIVIEGWCLSNTPIKPNFLKESINQLEQSMDSEGIWRNYVNQQLAGNYRELSGLINALLFLNPPNMEILNTWRAKQESKLVSKNKKYKTNLMHEKSLTFFMQHFERWTKDNLLKMPKKADIIFNLNKKHNCFEALYK